MHMHHVVGAAQLEQWLALWGRDGDRDAVGASAAQALSLPWWPACPTSPLHREANQARGVQGLRQGH